MATKELRKLKSQWSSLKDLQEKIEALKLIKSVMRFNLIVRATVSKNQNDDQNEDLILEIVEATPDEMTIEVLTIEELEY